MCHSLVMVNVEISQPVSGICIGIRYPPGGFGVQEHCNSYYAGLTERGRMPTNCSVFEVYHEERLQGAEAESKRSSRY